MKTKFNLLSFVLITILSTSLSAQEDIFKIVEEMPVYGDCTTIADRAEKKSCSDKAIYEFLSQNIIYPDSAQLKGTEGTVVLRFVVDKEGEIQDAEVVRDIGDGCGEEALRVLSLMDNWVAGKQKGNAESVQMHLPVKFRIHEIPVTIRTEKFEYLRDLFCTNYLTDFVRLDVIHAMADDELDTKDLCLLNGVENKFGKLKVTLTHNKLPKSVESEDGTFTPSMRKFLAEAVVGDVIEFEYELVIALDEDEENNAYKEIYKSVIVE